VTRRVGRNLVIEPEAPRTCSVCGLERECRPYGEGGADVCYACATATPESRRVAEEHMARRIGK